MRIAVNLIRFKKDFEEMSRIGRSPAGGASRLAFSPQDQAAREFIRAKMREVGLAVYQDPAGNIHGRRSGAENGPTVATGSHSDSVENGGHFDGVVGLLGAIEVMRALNDAGLRTRRGLEAICFLAEEANSFGLSCFGSRALSGQLSRSLLFGRSDPDGRTLPTALASLEVSPEAILGLNPRDFRYHAFVELHVEQGKALYNAKIPLGLVTDIVGAYRYRVKFVGQADHSGGSPMDQRRDALAAAAEAILAVERICRHYQTRDIVGTVGVIHVSPGMINVIPGECEIIIEVRGRVHFPKSAPVAEIKAALRNLARQRGVEVQIETLMEDESQSVSPWVLQALEESAKELGYPYLMMPSRTGHDAMHMTPLADIGMIFLPSREGIGHHPSEWTDMEDIEKGLQLLAAALVRLAET
ncbi:MAG: M20 family metallo-hydrolase [Thermodesulfobacteriota bacterium]